MGTLLMLFQQPVPVILTFDQSWYPAGEEISEN